MATSRLVDVKRDHSRRYKHFGENFKYFYKKEVYKGLLQVTEGYQSNCGNLSLKEAVCDGNICGVLMNMMDILWIGPHEMEIIEVCILQCNAFFLCENKKFMSENLKIEFFCRHFIEFINYQCY
tara:strand:- start:36 stop:407 length:372 start_codon:yes stop_codon:yes gene_type:complete